MALPPYSKFSFPWARSYMIGIKNYGLAFHFDASREFMGLLVNLQTCPYVIGIKKLRARIEVNRKTNRPNLPPTAFSDPGDPPLSQTKAHLLWAQQNILTLLGPMLIKINTVLTNFNSTRTYPLASVTSGISEVNMMRRILFNRSIISYFTTVRWGVLSICNCLTLIAFLIRLFTIQGITKTRKYTAIIIYQVLCFFSSLFIGPSIKDVCN